MRDRTRETVGIFSMVAASLIGLAVCLALQISRLRGSSAAIGFVGDFVVVCIWLRLAIRWTQNRRKIRSGDADTERIPDA